MPVRPHNPDPVPPRCLALAILAWSLAVTGTFTVPCVAVARDGRPGDNAPQVDFATQVRPIFARVCFKCHGPEKQRGGLQLDSRNSVLKGGDSGEPAIVPGDPDASALLERVASDDSNLRMPPKGEPLAAGELALLKRWVAEGATWPETDASARGGRAAMTITAADREHWSFRPLQPVNLPESSPHPWARTPVDQFVIVALLSKGLAPAPASDRRTLIRRVTFDLAGLPPTPEEIAAFVHDDGPAAYERLVDRLLASPRYGERWGRHWLDLARHADSDGYEGDRDRKTAYRYRDFVIQALNADMPFDQFVRWQLAGDEYAPDNALAVVATGFCTAAPSQVTTPADTEENKAKIRYDELDNMLATTGSALLGLSVGCARCHDHKFDPIPTRDYYRMLAAFQTSERRLAPLSRPHRELDHWLRGQRRLFREAKMTELGLTDNDKFWLRQPEHFFVPVQIELYKKYGKSLDPTAEQLRGWMSLPAQAMLDRLIAGAAKAEAAGADPKDTGLVLLDRSARPERAYLLGRGSVSNRQDAVSLGFLQVLTRGATPEDYLAKARSFAGPGGERNDLDPTLGTTYQRTALATVAHRCRGRRRRLAGASGCQPALAAPLRRGPGAHARRLWSNGRPARSSRAARMAGWRAHPWRLATQADSPADPLKRGLSSINNRRSGRHRG